MQPHPAPLPDGLAEELRCDYATAWNAWLLTAQARRRMAEAQSHGHASQRRAVRLFDGYRPHEKQWAVHQSGKRFALVVAGRRGGKTVVGCREFLRRIFRDRDQALASGERWGCAGVPKRQTPPLRHYWAIAPTYQLGLVQQRELARALKQSPELVINWAQNRLWLAGGCLIEFRTAEKPNSLVGEGIAGVWFDEAARCKRDAWHENVYPALADRAGWALFTSTPLGRNWLHELWQLASEPDSQYSAHTWFSVHNTAAPQVAIEAELARRTMPPAIYRRNFEADWDAFEGQIFDAFSMQRHVVPDSAVPRRAERRVGGVDWGFSNPGVLLELVRYQDTVYVAREHYERRLHVYLPEPARSWVSVAKEAKQRGTSKFWCDPASSENIAHFNRNAIAAYPAQNSVVEGIECVSMMLHYDDALGQKPRLQIAASCANLLRELPGYRYARDARGNSLETPVKADDHSVDALRYPLHSEETYRDLVPAMAMLRLVR